MSNEHVNVKVDIGTRRLLRLISAETGESIKSTVFRLASEEMIRIGLEVKPSGKKAVRTPEREVK